MRIENCPALSPRRASSRLLGKARKVARSGAALKIASRFAAWSSNPWKALTNSPPANASVLLSRYVRIILAYRITGWTIDVKRTHLLLSTQITACICLTPPRGSKLVHPTLWPGRNLRMFAVLADLKCLFFEAAIADAFSETFKALRQGGEAPA